MCTWFGGKDINELIDKTAALMYIVWRNCTEMHPSDSINPYTARQSKLTNVSLVNNAVVSALNWHVAAFASSGMLLTGHEDTSIIFELIKARITRKDFSAAAQAIAVAKR